jgi:LmbE family N-acetylglucosaminyl deacetylase
MRFHNPTADLFVPDGLPSEAALARTTHLAISAHQDDIEIMAYHGIAECFGRKDKWFTGVVATNGAGSPRSGIYGDATDEEMQQVRLVEQRKAAYVGEYACQIQLGFTSSQVKDPREGALVEDLQQILRAVRPKFVYLHNLADKHDTHVAVALRSIAALRAVRPDVQPTRVYGCEVWRDLDWLPDESKHRRPAPGARHLLRLPRDRPGERSQLRHGPDAPGGRRHSPGGGLRPGSCRPVPRGCRDAAQHAGPVTALRHAG